MNPETAVALWALNRLPSEQLPVVAYQWLEAGLDSPTLRILAGERDPIMSEVGPMFYDVLEELEFAIPTRGEAVALLASEVAQRIVNGTVSPYEGADQIGDLWIQYASIDGVDLSRDIGILAIEYECFLERPGLSFLEKRRCRRARAELDAKIVEEARKLIV